MKMKNTKHIKGNNIENYDFVEIELDICKHR